MQAPQSQVFEPTLDTLSPDEIRALAKRYLRHAPLTCPEADTSASDYDLNKGLSGPPARDLKPAAVLVPIIATEVPTLLLTERTPHLSAHAGQIAFPGGKIEPTDDGALGAALREAHEEIGLNASAVDPLGYLDPYRTGTGYLITPVVALVRPGETYRADPSEVADIFEVPLAYLMDVANHRIDTLFWRGADRRFYAMPYEQRYIWGATAGIIRMLYRKFSNT